MSLEVFMLRRCTTALLAVLLLGCAAAPPPDDSPRTRTRFEGTSAMLLDLEVMSSARPSPTLVPASADDVWKALPDAYETIGIPVATMHTSERLIGNRRLEVRGRLGEARLSEYLECGQSMMGRHADVYNVTLDVLTSVQSDGDDASLLRTRVTAWASSRGASGDPVRCTTNGRLERQIANLVLLGVV